MSSSLGTLVILPLEVRDMIWELVLCETKVTVQPDGNLSGLASITVLGLSGAIRGEILSGVIYRSATFVFERSESLLSFLNNLNARHLQRLRILHLVLMERLYTVWEDPSQSDDEVIICGLNEVMAAWRVPFRQLPPNVEEITLDVTSPVPNLYGLPGCNNFQTLSTVAHVRTKGKASFYITGCKYSDQQRALEARTLHVIRSSKVFGFTSPRSEETHLANVARRMSP